MIIKLKAFANFREILGGEQSLDIPDGSSVSDVLDLLKNTKPKFKEAAWDESGLKDYVILLLNRKRIDQEIEISRVLAEGDELAILPPVAGG